MCVVCQHGEKVVDDLLCSLPPGGTQEALPLGSCNAVHVYAQLTQLPKHLITEHLKSQMIPTH